MSYSSISAFPASSLTASKGGGTCFLQKYVEISVISGSGPEIENPLCRFVMLPVELLLLLSRLEAQQESLTLPNEISPMLASSLDKQL